MCDKNNVYGIVYEVVLTGDKFWKFSDVFVPRLEISGCT